MSRTTLRALFCVLLACAWPVAAKEKPLLNPGEHLPLLVEDPLAGVVLRTPDAYYYEQSSGGLMGAAFSAADQARAGEAAAIVAPLFALLNLADEIVAELDRSLDRAVFGRNLAIVRHPA